MKFEAPLHFANVANFREEVLKQLTALSSSPENVSTLKNGKVRSWSYHIAIVSSV